MLETRKEKEKNYIKFRNMLNNFIRDVKDDLDTEELLPYMKVLEVLKNGVSMDLLEYAKIEDEER